MAQDLNPTTYASATTQAPTIQGEIWRRNFIRTAYEKDVCSWLEGPDGGDKAFYTHYDLMGKEGNKVRFHTTTRLGGQVTLGESRLEGNEETRRFGGFQALLDYRRHGEALNKKIQNYIVGGKLLTMQSSEDLARHFACRKQREMCILLRDSVGERNQYFGGGKSGINDLRSADTITYDSISRIGSMLRTNATEPFRIDSYGPGGTKAQPVYRYGLLAEHESLASLRSDPIYQEAQRHSDVRGPANLQFAGGWHDIAGNALYEMTSVIDDAFASQRSALAPTALLGSNATGVTAVTLAMGDNNITLFGGGLDVANDVRVPFFEDFLGNPFRYDSEQAVTPDPNEDFYLLVFNNGKESSPGAGDGGQWGFYRYRSSAFNNDANTLVAAERLSATNTNVGDVDIAAAPWAGSIADAHPVGALVFQANSFGVPIGCSFGLSRGCAARCYSQNVQNKSQVEDYDFIKGLSYEASYGQAVHVSVDGLFRRHVVFWHALEFAGISFPEVV